MDTASPSISKPLTDARIWRTLTLQQWQKAGTLHRWFFIIWLLGIWVLLLMTHPAWLIAFGLIYVLLATPAMAGADVMDGTEEFSFSLPPGRGVLFATRLAVGLGFLLLTTGLGALAIGLDLPQALWSLVASSGITAPNHPVKPAFLYPLAVLVPVAAYAGTFSLASLAGSRAMVGLSWLGGVAAAGVLVLVTLQLESAIWGRANGWITCVALPLASALALLAGYFAYLNKEAVIGGGRASSGRGAGRVLLVLLALGLLLALFMSLLWVRESKPVSTPHRVVPLEHHAADRIHVEDEEP